MAAGNDTVSEKKKGIQPGAVVWCKTNLGEEFKGEVMGYDEETKAVVIKCSPTGKGKQKSLHDVVVVNLNVIAESNFQLLSLPEGEPPPLPDIDKCKINKRLKTAKERVGIGVSVEAQQLFDFIRKTITHCYWRGQNIFILDEVEIAPPYKLDNCTGKAETSLEYIRSIVSKFYNDSVSPRTSPVSLDSTPICAT